MSRGGSESLAAELVRDLRPVRPIPRVRVALAGVVAAFGLALATDAVFGGWWPRSDPGSYWGDPGYVAVFCGLVLTAVAALVTALAGAVPGRDALARRSRNAALLGAGVALAGGVLAIARAASGAPESSWVQHLSCAGHACALGVVPALLAGAFLARASTRRPFAAACVAALGAVSLGAFAIHAACSAGCWDTRSVPPPWPRSWRSRSRSW
jgi:hypothetical protein